MTNSLVSVIIPVYNVEKYVGQSIDSVINQKYSNLEIILVNDGSTDESAGVLEQYAKKDDRIRVIHQENSGVSVARNVGLEHATGSYIHFFDGDDLLSKDFYTESVAMLEVNENIDVVASKIKFFDSIIDSHILNNKFYKKRVIDLKTEPDNPLLHLTSCIFKTDSIKDHKFDSRLKVSEDVTFISEVLANKKAYGVVTKPTYYYRKRGDGSSAINSKLANKSYYIDTPRYGYKHSLDIWKESGDSKFAEYTFLYDLSYILEQTSQKVLSTEELSNYKKNIFNLVKMCSDESICLNAYLSVHKKLYVLKLKHENDFDQNIKTIGTKLYFNRYELYDYSVANVFVDFIQNENDEYTIEGYIDSPLLGANLMINNNHIEARERTQRRLSFLGDVYFEGGAFKGSINESDKSVRFNIDINGSTITLPIKAGPFTRLASHGFAYRVDERVVVSKHSKQIRLHNRNIAIHIYYELRQLFRILTYWKFDELMIRFRAMSTRNFAQLSYKARLFEIAKPFLFSIETVVMIPRAFLYRAIYYVVRPTKKRPIWIVSDRSMMAGDNGEAFFRYINTQEDCPADVFFAMSKKSEDYERLKNIGRVIDQESWLYKIKFLLADKIIASQAEIETTNPFFRLRDHFVDLYNFDFIFLQHGIIRHDLSTWLNRYNVNISLFITSAQKEYDSIFDLPYYYEKKNVLLSGLARYDYLESKPESVLMLAPTYRKNLVREKTDSLGRRGYDILFKKSDYRDFYNKFINDKRIINALKDKNMTGEFYLHPVFSAQYPDFESNDIFKVMRVPYKYSDALKRASAIVSDYSSIIFDMAYMKKPIVYSQYDRATFFEGHSYDESDFFRDKEDGFGPVYHDYESLVEGTISMIYNGCSMDKKYIDNVDKFFYKIDKRNSARIYDAILNMSK